MSVPQGYGAMLRSGDSDLAKQIGRRARTLRERLSATQEEVAEKVGLSAQVYARLERGLVLPSVRSLMQMCAALEATPNELLGDEAKPRGRAPASATVARLTRAVGTMDEETARLLLPLVKRLRTRRP